MNCKWLYRINFERDLFCFMNFNKPILYLYSIKPSRLVTTLNATLSLQSS